MTLSIRKKVRIDHSFSLQGSSIPKMGNGQSYKYLGCKEASNLDEQPVPQLIFNEFLIDIDKVDRTFMFPL